ncbi:hypothetical protein ICW40_17380 [Actinotalea ferrariae]|uniref:hypothetical protein n=1 Tax=Actinotalea ferrariae TaxID=1386098 RepID=UPI001C8CE3A3|nr:hypothetical protein [Actinotalea ferrariae]MBX9246564.1 hypothetical protein [Actinotalea ferrariae]
MLPTGDPALPAGACGSLVGEPSVDDGSGLSITAWPVPAEVPAGSALPVGAGMGFGQYGDFSLASQDGPVYLVTHDGVVVARGTAFASTTGVATLVEGGPGGWTTAGALDLAVCEPVAGDPATAGRALPAGSYELHATLQLTRLPEGTDVDDRWTGDPADDLVGTPGGEPVQLLSEPVAFTVVGEALDPAPRTRTSPAAPAADRPPPGTEMCGSAVPERWDAGGLLVIEHPTDPLAVAVGDPVDLGARLAYRVPGRVEGLLEHRIDYLVVRDGVVVGRGGPGASDDWWSHATVDHGTVLRPDVFFQEWVIAGCIGTDPWDPTNPPLGPGEYELVPTTTLQLDAVVLDDGTRTVLDQTHFLVGTPVPLTIR